MPQLLVFRALSNAMMMMMMMMMMMTMMHVAHQVGVQLTRSCQAPQVQQFSGLAVLFLAPGWL
jgi:uncharacterized membrane protein